MNPPSPNTSKAPPTQPEPCDPHPNPGWLPTVQVHPGLSLRVSDGARPLCADTLRMPPGILIAVILEGAARLTLASTPDTGGVVGRGPLMLVGNSASAFDCCWSWCPALARRVVVASVSTHFLATACDGGPCSAAAIARHGPDSQLRAMPLPTRIAAAAEELLLACPHADAGELRISRAALTLVTGALDVLRCDAQCCGHARDRRRIAEAWAMLAADPGRSWTIGSLARAAGVNERKLKVGFRVDYGTTVKAALTAVRLSAGYDMISEGQVRVSQAARSVGYAKPRYFTDLFHRRYGFAPSGMIRAE